MKYARESLTLEEVQAALKSKQIENKSTKENIAEGLSIRGRPERKDFKNQRKNRSRSRTRNPTRLKCYHCHKEGHFRRQCPDRLKLNDKYVNKGDAAIVEDGYESTEVLAVSDTSSTSDWIMDSGCSFHMTPNRTWFEEFVQEDGVTVLLGNNKSCKVQGSGLV